MNTEGADRENREEPCPELLTAKDALRLELRPIEVPENAELLLSQLILNMLLAKSKFLSVTRTRRGVILFDGFRLMGKGRRGGGGEQCHL
jgi:hypothetical protein